jgi:hypothetical protein
MFGLGALPVLQLLLPVENVKQDKHKLQHIEKMHLF